MATGAVDKENVSTTRGIKGGYLFSAPAGTDVPTDIKTPLSDDYVCAGFVSEDGFTEGLDGGSDSIKDMNGDVCDSYSEAKTETLAFQLIEMSEEALSVQYGHQNVSTNDGVIVVDHNWGKSEEERAWVLELVLKNGRRWRKVVPRGKLTELGEFSGNSTTVAGREVTLTYQTDSTGSGCKDYIEVVDADDEEKEPEIEPQTLKAEVDNVAQPQSTKATQTVSSTTKSSKE